MNDSRVKIISEVEADDAIISVKSPFKLFEDRKRRYIRLEVSEPITYSILKNRSGGFWPQGNGASHSGSIINLSAGGVLILSDSTLEEGTILLLKMSLQDIEVIDNVIGMVKRVDADENAWLLGVEFITVEYLDDIFSRSELDTLPGSIASFDEQVKKTLNKYVYYKKVSREEY